MSASPADDAELIRLCDLVVANKAAINALCDTRHTVEDEERTEPELDDLFREKARALVRLDRIGWPTTTEGAQAMARAAVACAPRDNNEQIIADSHIEWLALGVVNFLGEGGQNPSPRNGRLPHWPMAAAMMAEVAA